MTDGIGNIGARGGDVGRSVERTAAAVRQDARQESRQARLGQVSDALREAQPLVERLGGTAVDPIALGQARERIAAMLADVTLLSGDIAGGRAALADRLDAMASAVTIPLAPGAGEDAVAAAQALAQLIAANARPALSAQAHIGAASVRVVTGD